MSDRAGRDDRRPTPAGSRSVGVAALVLGAAIPATFAVTVLLVVSHETTAQAGATATSSAAPSTAVEPPAAPVVAFPDLTALPLGEAVAGLEEAGAQVTRLDARGWDRDVQPGWDVCTQTQLFEGDVGTDQVHLAAVPAGDPCP